MDKTYAVTLTIPFDETDFLGNCRLPYLLSLALTVSGQHSESLGLSDDWVYAQYGLFWVVTEHQLTIERLPVYQETIRIETTLTSYNRFFCYRLFEIFDEAGNLLVKIVSSFVLLDAKTRQMVSIPETMLAPFQTMFVKKIVRSPKLKPLEESLEKAYPIRYFDLDRNGHVNNSRYLEWVYDGLPMTFLMGHRPSELLIKYSKEIAPNQQVMTRTWQEGLVSQHDFLADGQLSTQVRVIWEKCEEKGS